MRVDAKRPNGLRCPELYSLAQKIGGLIFGNIEIQCYVLDNETRVLTMRSLQSGIGMSEGGGKGGARKIPALMSSFGQKGHRHHGFRRARK